MSSISFTTQPSQPDQPEHVAIQLVYSFGKDTSVTVTKKVGTDMPMGKTLIQIQAELWEAVAADASTLAKSLRQLDRAG